MRCFLAVPLEHPALADAQRLLRSLKQKVPAVRWVRPESMHITVHFFGGLDEDGARVALEAVRPVAERTPSFHALLDRLGTFPERGRPRVLWLGASHEAQALGELAHACRDALGAAGFEIDARPFRGHVTLGRPSDPWPVEARDGWRAAGESPVRARPFTAARLVLFDSRSAAGGNVYSELESMPLRGSRWGRTR